MSRRISIFSLAAAISVATAAQPQSAPPRVVIDRVTASVGGVPITRRDVEMEWRLETLLQSGRAPEAAPSKADLGAARGRLIDQALLEQALSGFQADQAAAGRNAGQRVEDLRKKFSSQGAFASALQNIGLTEPTLTARLKEQDEILQMINGQLRPAAAVTPQDIQTYYEQSFAPAFAGKGPAPPLKQVQDQIREIVTQQKINQLLDQWLSQLKKEHPVTILSYPSP